MSEEFERGNGGAKFRKSRTFTVVTPNFNMARYLEATIQSVLPNLRPGDQYFVIDGGSNDGSQEIIQRYATRLTGWISERDHGYADALAKGFARGTGELMCWINSSDLLLSGALDLARDQLDRSGADMIFGDNFYMDDAGRVIFFSRGCIHDLRAAMLYGAWTPLQDACFWTRAAYERVGGLNPKVSAAADYDFFLRLATRGTVRYVPYAFSAFRKHSGQKSIHDAKRYKCERNRCRTSEMDVLRVPFWRRRVLEAWHKMLVRGRIHVMQRLWKLPELDGRSVHELPAGRYWKSL